MSLRGIVVALVRVVAAASPTAQEFFAKNGFKEEEKEEEGGEENMEGFIHKSKGFLLMNLPNPKKSLLIQKELKEKDQKS